MTEVYQKAMVEDEEDNNEEGMLDVATCLKSIEYKKYIQACCELEKVDILVLNRSQRAAFFLNVY